MDPTTVTIIAVVSTAAGAIIKELAGLANDYIRRIRTRLQLEMEAERRKFEASFGPVENADPEDPTPTRPESPKG